ncbi:MAG: hypothetical protein NC033_06715 [Clostridiales bacterium]|nr:hypothetical protein [Clostridiales bacterium]
MAENNKKFSIVSIVILAVLGVALIMGIVGLCIDWLGMSYKGDSEMIKLKELIDANKDAKAFANLMNQKAKVPYPGAEAAQAFGIIAVISAALCACSYVVSKFVDIKALKWVTVGCAALLALSALIALICTFVCGTSEYCKKIKDMGAKILPAAGCWLLSIFGIVGGAAGIYGGLKG